MLSLLLKSINVNQSGIYDVGSGSAISIKNLALKILKIFCFKSKIKFIKPLKSTNYLSKSNIKKTTKLFNWEPKVELVKGLKQIKF